VSRSRAKPALGVQAEANGEYTTNTARPCEACPKGAAGGACPRDSFSCKREQYLVKLQ